MIVFYNLENSESVYEIICILSSYIFYRGINTVCAVGTQLSQCISEGVVDSTETRVELYSSTD